jgi:hypothetical protein
MKESCRQNAMAANFFRTKAVEADAAIKELFSAFESVKAKILSDFCSGLANRRSDLRLEPRRDG